VLWLLGPPELPDFAVFAHEFLQRPASFSHAIFALASVDAAAFSRASKACVRRDRCGRAFPAIPQPGLCPRVRFQPKVYAPANHMG